MGINCGSFTNVLVGFGIRTPCPPRILARLARPWKTATLNTIVKFFKILTRLSLLYIEVQRLNLAKEVFPDAKMAKCKSSLLAEGSVINTPRSCLYTRRNNVWPDHWLVRLTQVNKATDNTGISLLWCRFHVKRSVVDVIACPRSC